MKNKTKQEIVKIIDEKLKKSGLKMTKKITSEYSGFLAYSPALYDDRKVYSLKELHELNQEGFSVDDNEDLGLFLLNAFLTN